MTAYLNAVATAVPSNDVHAAFVTFAGRLLSETRSRPLFDRLVHRSQIEHRWSVLGTGDPELHDLDRGGFYRLGAFPSTGERMKLYETHGPDLAVRAVESLGLGERAREITHVIVTSCTGFAAPGIDLHLVQACHLNPSVERTVIGFMGCYAAINGLKAARHIVRSEPQAKVLLVSLELCTLHLQETEDLEQVLSFLVFGDGCAAAVISAEEQGFALDSFHAVLAPHAADQITWNIRDHGFDMVLSGQVPGSVGAALRTSQDAIFGDQPLDDIELWAVHPGGRSVLDAVESALQLGQGALFASRDVLRRYGNMSSATILFVLAELLRVAKPGQKGCGMAFGPGLTAETMMFHAAG